MKEAQFGHLNLKVDKSSTLNERSSLIEPFVSRINNARKVKGYKPYTAGYIAMKMSHIDTEDLDEHYKMLDKSRAFSALWHWYNTNPKKKA